MEVLPWELVYRISFFIADDDLISWSLVEKKLSNICFSKEFWIDKIAEISASRANRVTNASVSHLRRIYRKIGKRGKLFICGFTQNYGRENINVPFPFPGFSRSDIIQVSLGLNFLGCITIDGQVYLSSKGKSLKLVKHISGGLQISAGRMHMAVITDQGQLYVWGRGMYGQLGLHQVEETFKFLLLPFDQRIIQVACGTYHTAFITEKGQVYTMGKNVDGALGRRGSTYTPGIISDIPIAYQVSCGDDYTVILTNKGEVYGVGNNYHGQLGGNGQENILYPRLLISPVTQISCGTNLSAFIDDNHQLYLMGRRINGQYGIKKIPRFFSVTQVSCGYDNVIFINEGIAYGMGNDIFGNLGLGDIGLTTRDSFDDILEPSPIKNLFPVHYVSMGINATGYIIQ